MSYELRLKAARLKVDETLDEQTRIADKVEQAQEILRVLEKADLTCDSVAKLLEALNNRGCLVDRKVCIIQAVKDSTGCGLGDSKACVELVL